MTTRLEIYSNADSETKTVTVDFTSAVSAFTTDATSNPQNRFYFIFKCSARDSADLRYADRIVEDQDDLVLNRTKRSISDSNTAYTTITDMVTDFVYDYINGHTADQFSSGVGAKASMF